MEETVEVPSSVEEVFSGQQITQEVDLNGFDEVNVKAGVLGSNSVVIVAITRHGHDDGLLPTLIPSQNASDL